MHTTPQPQLGQLGLMRDWTYQPYPGSHWACKLFLGHQLMRQKDAHMLCNPAPTCTECSRQIEGCHQAPKHHRRCSKPQDMIRATWSEA